MKKTLMLAAVALVAFVGYSCKPKAEAPKAMFEYEVAEDDVTTVQFTNLSKNATTYKWEFGDNETSTETNPKHTYAEGGVYSVTLTAEGEGGTSTYTEEISLVAPKVKIDGKFNDWDKMVADKEATLVSIDRPESGFYADRYALQNVLITTDENFIYYALTFQSDDDYMHVMQYDICFDADNDAATGKDRSSYWENMGMEYLIQYGDEAGKLAKFNDDSTPESWAYWRDWSAYTIYHYGDGMPEDAQVSMPNDISERVVSGATTRVEGRLPLTNFAPIGITGTSTIGIKCASQGWELTSGQLPTPLEEDGSKIVVPCAQLKF